MIFLDPVNIFQEAESGGDILGSSQLLPSKQDLGVIFLYPVNFFLVRRICCDILGSSQLLPSKQDLL